MALAASLVHVGHLPGIISALDRLAFQREPFYLHD